MDKFKKSNSGKSISTRLYRRIINDQNKTMNEIFVRYELEQIPSVVTKINLERSVFEYDNLFRNYTQQLLKLDSNNYILDFTDTNFMDSSFYGTLIIFLKQINANNKTLKLVINSKKNILFSKNIAISKFFDIYCSIDEALASY